MKTIMGKMLILVLMLSLFSACGGDSSTDNTSVPPPTKATVTLSSVVTDTVPPDTIIAGYEVTITLPAGVTVKTSPSSTDNPPPIEAGVLTAAAADSFLYGVYSAATASSPGTIRIFAISLNANGFSVGDFATVNGDIASGYRPKAEDFSQAAYSTAGVDTSGQGASVDLTSQVTVTASAFLH